MANQIRYQVGFDVQKTNLNQLKSSLQELQKMKISDVVKINQTDIASARDVLKSIQQDAGKVENALNKAFNTKLNTINIQTFNRELSSANLTIEQVYRSFSRAGASGEAAFRNLSTQILSTNIQLRESHAILDKMAVTFANTLKWNAASAAVNGLSRSVQEAWGYVKSLDTSLNDIRVVTGKSADEMATFAVKANQAAKSLGKTTTDYTNAALIFAQQGLNDKEIQERAKITLKAANVTGQSTDAVSEQLTAVWNGYKVTAEEAELYVDRLAAVAATTASDLEELSTGMSKVASAAAAMGVGEDQLAAQLSTIISVTKQAPESVGTALRTVYARISDIKAGIDEDGVTLGNYSGKMAELGINVLDTNGNLRDMGEVMEEIGGKWGDLTREQQIYLAQTMAGQRQYNNLLALFDNFEQYNEALNTARNAAGTLQQQQDIYMESTRAHLEQLTASIEKIYNSLADTETINGLIDGLSEAATFVSKLVDSLGGGKAVLSSLGTIGFSVFSQQIANGIQTTINNLENARDQAQRFKDAIQQAEELQRKGLGNEYTQFLQREQSVLLNMGSKLPVKDFNAIQQKLQQLSQTSGDIEILEQKIELLGKSFNSLGTDVDKAASQWGTLDDMLSSADGVETIKNALNNLKENFDPIIEKQQQIREAFKTMYIDIENGSPKAEQSFNNLKIAMLDLINSFKTTTLGDSTNSLFSALPESARKSVLKAKFELQNLDFSQIGNPQQASTKITQIFANLNQSITNEINTIKQLIKSADEGQLEGLQEKLRHLLNLQQQVEDEYDHLRTKAEKSISMQQFTSIAGGIAQVGSAIRQVQNLGSIWKNADLSLNDKILQTVTNLAISLPMLVTGLMKVNKAMDLVSISAEAAQGKIRLFGTSLQVNPWFLAATAILSVVTALSAYVEGVNEAREARIRQNQSIIDQENAHQQEIQSTQQLLSALQELDQQRENGEISRSELKSSIQDLIHQYGLEGQAADNLAHSYDNLAEYIHKARRQAAQEAKDSARRQLDAAGEVVKTTALQQGADGHITSETDYSETAQYARSVFMGEVKTSKEKDALIELFKNSGLINDQGLLSIDFNTKDANDVLETYEQLESVLNQIYDLQEKGKISEEDLDDSQLYQIVFNLLQQLNPAIQAYRAAKADFDKADIDFAIEDLVEKDVINFSSNIKNLQDYVEEREELIKQLRNNEGFKDLSDEQIANKADDWLSDRYRSLYTQYNDAANYIEQIRKKFGETNASVEQMISNMDEDHLGMLMNLDQSTIKDWDTLAGIIQHIAGIDLSNTAAAIALDPESVQAAASDQYNIYQSLEDQVRGGKTISKKEMESLDPEIQEFFSMMANGTFKMTGDAEDFYNKVNSLKLDGFFETLDTINRELEQNQALQDKNFNYDVLDQSANTTQFVRGEGRVDTIDYDLVKYQLDYLQTVTDTNSELGEQIKLWIGLAENVKLEREHVDAIAEAVSKAGDKTANLTERQQELKEMAEEVAHQLHDAMFPTDEDIDTDVLETLSETIQDIADESDELAGGLAEDSRAAEDVAESILRFDNAIEDVVDNYKDWMDALNSGSIQEQAEIIDDLRDAYADLLDLDGSALSNDFLTNTENLDLMKAAIDGDIDAYDELLSRAGQDIITHLQLSPEDYAQFQNDLADVQTMMDEMNFEDIEIGANLDTGNFISQLENMVNAAGMTAQQATDYLASMGVDAEVIEQKTEGTETKQVTGYHGEANNAEIPYDFVYMNGTSLEHYTGSITAPGVNYVPDTETVTDTKENSAFSLKVTSAHKSSGGNFKFGQTKNGNGSKGTARRTPSSKGGKGGSKGGKGGGSGSQPDKSKKDLKKPLEDQRDLYHDINIQLEKTERSLNRIQKMQDRLYGKQLLDNLAKQKKLLEQQKDVLERKQKIQQQDLKQQQQTLKNLGATFDQQGNIANYMDIIGQKQNKVNTLIAEENKLIKKYNSTKKKEAKEALSELITKQQKKVKDAEDDLNKTQDKIKDYDKLRENMEDVVDQIEELTQQEIELNIKEFRVKVQIHLQMGEAERDWNKFRRQVLEKTDLMHKTDFDDIFAGMNQDFNDLYSYFDVHGSVGTIETLTDKLLQTKQIIEDIDSKGTGAIYSDAKEKAMEDLQNDLKQLMKQMGDIEKLIDNIDQAYLDTIDDVEQQFGKQIEDYEYINELVQHDMDLLSLLYGDKNYDAMNRYYQTLQRNNINQLDSLKQQRGFWKEQWDAAVARGDTNAAEKFKEKYKKAITDLNKLIEQSAKTIQEKYSNSINKIFDELDKRLTNGRGIDYLQTQWDLINKNADEYLDTINAAFAVQQAERKYRKALDDTKSIKNQQALKKLMNEQLDILKNKEKISQYDIDRAEKVLQLEQARIALEQAQAAKTSLRLKRDAQGNYSYQYTADSASIDDAQSNYDSAFLDLHNLDADQYKTNQEKMLSAYQEYIDKRKEILEKYAGNQEEQIKRIALLDEEYGEYVNDRIADNFNIRLNLMQSTFKSFAYIYQTDVANYQQMAEDEKQILMENLVPTWNTGIEQMAETIAGEGGLLPACEQGFEEVTDATHTYQKELDELASTAGINLDDVQKGVDDTAEEFERLVQKNDDLLLRMNEEINTVESLREAAKTLATQYGAVYTAAKQAASAIHQFIQAQQKAAAIANGNADDNNNNNNNSNRNNPSGSRTSPKLGDGNKSGSSGPSGGNSSGGPGTGSGPSSGSNRNVSTSSFNTGGCFCAGTKIIMSDNSIKNIEDVKIGDIVMAYNTQKTIYELKPVVNIISFKTFKLAEVTLSNNVILKMTPGHPILTTLGWKSLDIQNSKEEHNVDTTLLKIGDEVLGFENNVFITNIKLFDKKEIVYDIQVQKCHTFIANGIVVHNSSIKRKMYYATGGYTGEWGDEEGRLAFLHQKELVLNQEDTKNILNSVNILRNLVDSAKGNIFTKLSNINGINSNSSINNSNMELEQDVHIEANFPNVNSKREIEEAFSELVNLAAQRIMR